MSGLSTARGKGEALVRSGGPGKCMVGGSAAFAVQSGWKTGSGVRLGQRRLQNMAWKGGRIMQSFGPHGFGH